MLIEIRSFFHTLLDDLLEFFVSGSLWFVMAMAKRYCRARKTVMVILI